MSGPARTCSCTSASTAAVAWHAGKPMPCAAPLLWKQAAMPSQAAASSARLCGTGAAGTCAGCASSVWAACGRSRSARQIQRCGFDAQCSLTI